MDGKIPHFLGITESKWSNYDTSSCIVQQIPYEHTSSYKQGSAHGPHTIIENSQYVEFYDIELDQETYKKCGIACTKPLIFGETINQDAMHLIHAKTSKLLKDNKFVVSLGAEHTVTYGIFKAFQEKYRDIGILQLDAHSDLRLSYNGNEWSHASVMARIHELKPEIFQVGIRAQSIEENQLIQNSSNIHTWYAHQIWEDNQWMDEVIEKLPEILYITIDTDGFDPSICPSVGTTEPGGLLWYPTLQFLRKVFKKCDVKGFDIVELNPKSQDDITAYHMAQLCYKLIGYKYSD